jgi:hypothetical protein
MPGDDLSIPNMIISQRRELYYGSEFELELLNVPDGEKSKKYTVKVKLLDENGKTVYASDTLSFDSGKMMDHTIRLNTAKLTQYRLLAPEITVFSGGNKQIFSSGLPFTVMRPAVCDDHSWYCTPLRNLLKAVSAKVDFKKQTDGMVHVKAQLNFKEKLNSVEILQNVYSMQILDPSDEFGTSDGSKQLFLLTLTNVTGKKTTLAVDVNADSAVAFSIPLDTREQAVGEIFPVK